MGKDNYSQLCQVEQGEKVSWASIVYGRLMLEVVATDKQRSSSKSKMGVILAALFVYIELSVDQPVPLASLPALEVSK